MTLSSLIFTIIAIRFTVAVISYGSCDTPLDELGECIALEDCSHLKAITTRSNKTSVQINYLKQSQCGYLSGKVLICCPNRYVTEAVQRVAPPKLAPSVVSTRSHLAKLPEPPICGQNLAIRIFGGTETKPAEYPWTVLLIYTKPGNMLSHYCAGSLISGRYVLTAAHCIQAQDPTLLLTHVRLGEWDTQTNPDCVQLPNGRMDCAAPHLEVPIVETIMHPRYDRRSPSQHNDIALLRLETEVQFTKNIQPICLPINPDQRNKVFINVTMEVVGWGFTEELTRSTKQRKAELAVRDNSVCIDKYIKRNVFVQTSQICAGGEAGIDSCSGDSGGPLSYLEVYNGIESNYLAGIVSLGPKDCGREGWPGVYTRVDVYMDWILDTIQD